MKLKNAIKQVLPTFIRQLYTPREINVICIGTPKSGTTSIARLFSDSFRSEHEAERPEHVNTILAHFDKKMSDDEYVAYLQKRDKRLWLDLESNCFLGYRIDLTYRAFPKNKYILTIREPLSWLDSIFDNNINYAPIEHSVMEKWHKFFFKPKMFDYQHEEASLLANKLYPLSAYLNYWLESNSLAINSIPTEQLLVLDTNKISDSYQSISRFLGISQNSLSAEKSHANRTAEKYGMLSKLDNDFVREKIELICDNFIQKQNLFNQND